MIRFQLCLPPKRKSTLKSAASFRTSCCALGFSVQRNALICRDNCTHTYTHSQKYIISVGFDRFQKKSRTCCAGTNIDYNPRRRTFKALFHVHSWRMDTCMRGHQPGACSSGVTSRTAPASNTRAAQTRIPADPGAVPVSTEHCEPTGKRARTRKDLGPPTAVSPSVNRKLNFQDGCA